VGRGLAVPAPEDGSAHEALLRAEVEAAPAGGLHWPGSLRAADQASLAGLAARAALHEVAELLALVPVEGLAADDARSGRGHGSGVGSAAGAALQLGEAGGAARLPLAVPVGGLPFAARERGVADGAGLRWQGEAACRHG